MILVCHAPCHAVSRSWFAIWFANSPYRLMSIFEGKADMPQPLADVR